MMLDQDKSLEFESLVRSYLTDGSFSEPFFRAYFYNTDPNITAALDVNGEVPLPPGVLLPFAGPPGGRNISNIQVLVKGGKGVIVYWTKYAGFIWSR